jgi:uncharacterized protein YndB with AHSA1/START domain
MVQPLIRVQTHLDFPAVIVWDALVDADLLSGWLAESDVDLRVGGRFDLRWLPIQGIGHTWGEITDIHDGELLRVETSNLGIVSFVLSEVEGGSRGMSTELAITIAADLPDAVVADLVATVRTSGEQLANLLHGHPVDWPEWVHDWYAIWQQHRPHPLSRVT